jgi:hypothetical protein
MNNAQKHLQVPLLLAYLVAVQGRAWGYYPSVNEPRWTAPGDPYNSQNLMKCKAEDGMTHDRDNNKRGEARIKSQFIQTEGKVFKRNECQFRNKDHKTTNVQKQPYTQVRHPNTK